MAPINAFAALQAWYRSNCDGDWEHDHAIVITNIDNPGWAVSIPLSGTPLQDRPFTRVAWRRSEEDWATIRVESDVFLDDGGSESLVHIVQTFVEWKTKGHVDWRSPAVDGSGPPRTAAGASPAL